MKEHESLVIQWLRNNQTKGARLLQKLVQENSTRGKESSAQAIVIEKCRQLGLELDIWELEKEVLSRNPAFFCDRNHFNGNPNLVAVLKGTGGGKSMILNGHIDVVPVGDEEDWEDDPFSGIVKDGLLYGRGATDMKGGTAALLLAMEALIACGIRMKGDLIFQSVIEEESGGAGTLAAVLRGYHADGAIIPEPTNMRIFPKQQGSMWFRITVKGKSAHGGTRYEGVNAIEKSVSVLEGLQTLEKQRNEKITDPLYEKVPIPIPINVGKIASGEWPSSVPDQAVIEGRMGVAPEEAMETAQQEMEDFLAGLAQQDEWFQKNKPQIEWFGARWLPGSINQEHPLTQALIKSYLQIKKENPVIEASPWGTDGGILSRVGHIPAVIFGPGITETAHKANEHIALEQVYAASEIIALAIMDWCEMGDRA